jgi:hypothetical protein
LSVQISDGHVVAIDECQMTHTRSGEIHRDGATEPSHSHNGDPRRGESLLRVRSKARECSLAHVGVHGPSLAHARFTAKA